VFGFSPACVENQLLELVMDPKEGIECKGYARHDAKGDLVPFKFLRRSGRDLNSLILNLLLLQEFVTMGQSFETIFSCVLKLDFLKTSDKVVWKFLQWTPGIGWPSTSGQFID